MTSTAQVCALFRAYYGVANDVAPLIALIPDQGRQSATACVVAPEGLIHQVKVSLHDTDPLQALRDDLIINLLARLRHDLDALIPLMGYAPGLAPLVRFALMLRFGKAYVALRKACVSGSASGRERARAAHHAYEDAAAALMEHVAEQGD